MLLYSKQEDMANGNVHFAVIKTSIEFFLAWWFLHIIVTQITF